MDVLLWIVVPLTIVMIISGVALKRNAPVILALPVMIAALGVLWMYSALEHYQRATGRELNGLIGYHYSVPDWGFEYAPNGRHMERWSFNVPALTTLILLLASAVAASVNKWRELRAWGIVGLWVYHFGCAVAFMLVYALTWMNAASVFI
jgi:hypothetical protein